MANRRMISKSISTSEKLTKLYNIQKKDKFFPVLLFTWLQPHVDDWGRCSLNTATETCPECGKEVCGGCMEDGRCLTCLFSWKFKEKVFYGAWVKIANARNKKWKVDQPCRSCSFWTCGTVWYNFKNDFVLCL